MKTITRFLASIFLSLFLGSIISTITGIGLWTTIGILIALSLVVRTEDNGVLSSVVLLQAWEQELLKSLKSVKDDFLSRVPDKSHLVGNNVINITQVGVKPNVLIDNTTYPISGGQRIDDSVIIQLRKLTTEYTTITADELYALPYDKPGSVIEQHKQALVEEFRKIALHSFCPVSNTPTTPVIETTGEDDGTGRRRLTKADLIRFRRLLNDLGVGACELVLCNEHVEDILLWSEAFVNQYQIIATGMVVPMFGFYISQNQGYAPSFKNKQKKPFGANSEPEDVQASVAYVAERMFKAYGSVQMFYSEPEPRYQRYEINFNAYFAAVPKDSNGTGAIISGRV